MPRRSPEPPARPLETYLVELSKMYAAQRCPQPRLREVGKAKARMARIWPLLTLAERLRVRQRERELNDDFRDWLAERPEGPPPSRRRGAPDESTAPRKRPMPTAALPASECKVATLTERCDAGMELFDPDDADDDPDRVLRVETARNGSIGLREQGLPIVDRQGRRLSFGQLLTPIPGTVQRLREQAGLSRKALARRSGLSLWAISQIESGRRKRPRADTLLALARALNTTIDALLGRRGAG